MPVLGGVGYTSCMSNRILDIDRTATPGWFPGVDWFFSRALWREIAKELPNRPDVIADAIEHMRHEIDNQTGRASARLWLNLLESGVDEVIRVVTDPSNELPQVVRTSAPRAFAGVLPQRLRNQIYMQVIAERRLLLQDQGKSDE